MQLTYPLIARPADEGLSLEDALRKLPGVSSEKVWVSPCLPSAALSLEARTLLMQRKVPALFHCSTLVSDLEPDLWDGIFLDFQTSLSEARKRVITFKERYSLPVWCFSSSGFSDSAPEACVAVLQKVGAEVIGFSGDGLETMLASCQTVCETYLGVAPENDADWTHLAQYGVGAAVSSVCSSLAPWEAYEHLFDANSELCRTTQMFHCASVRSFFPLPYSLTLLPPVSIYSALRKVSEFRRNSGSIAQVILKHSLDLDCFLKQQMQLDCPLCLTSRSSDLLEHAAAEYGGILLLHPLGSLSEEGAERWIRRYGAVIV